jgi:D-glycero-alpha-D-manno-heptose 1-phosphate guanylyltransferase
VKTIILAGGLGTRLRSIISDKPKPMAQIGGKPFLEWQIELLKRFNLRDIILSVGYMANEIKNYFGNGKKYDVDIKYAEEEEPLGTGGALINAKSFVFGEDKFIVMNGDTYLNIDFMDFIRFHDEKKGLATIALVATVDEPYRYGSVKIDGNCRVIEFIEKGDKSFGSVNAGAYIFDSNVYHYMPDKDTFSLEYDFFPALLKTKRIFGYKTNCYFRDLGTPEDYEKMQRELEESI